MQRRRLTTNLRSAAEGQHQRQAGRASSLGTKYTTSSAITGAPRDELC